MTVRVEDLPPRRVAVMRHPGTLDDVDQSRRPLYQVLIQHEAVSGPSMLRLREPDSERDGGIDVVVPTAAGFTGAEGIHIEELPGGPHAVLDYEGPAAGLAEARQELLAWAAGQRHGPLLQVHLYDEVDGVTEQRLELPLLPPQ